MARVIGVPQLQARFQSLAGPEKMKLLAAAAMGELRKNSPGQKTRMTANSWQVASTTADKATVKGSIVNLWLDEGTGLFGPLHHRITPKAAQALRWASSASKGFRLSGAPRAVKGNVIGYTFARSTKGMKARPFIKRSVDAIGGQVGADVIVKLWNSAGTK